MSVLNEQTLNRFPLRGAHLRILLNLDGPVGGRQVQLPDATTRRLTQQLVALGLVAPGDRRGEFFVAQPAFVRAVNAALEERPDLLDVLDNVSVLPILCALPARDEPSLRLSAAVSGPTWRNTLDALGGMNLIVRGRQGWYTNPLLPAVRSLIDEVRQLHVGWDDNWAAPSDERGRPLVMAIHQRGVEAAWRVQNGDVSGLPTIGWEHPFFSALNPIHVVAYRGRRELELLDQALLLLRAEASLDWRRSVEPSPPILAGERTDVDLFDPRILGLVAAGCTQGFLETRRCEAAFQFYGLEGVYRYLWQLFQHPRGAVWQFRHSYVQNRDVEGAFA